MGFLDSSDEEDERAPVRRAPPTKPSLVVRMADLAAQQAAAAAPKAATKVNLYEMQKRQEARRAENARKRRESERAASGPARAATARPAAAAGPAAGPAARPVRPSWRCASTGFPAPPPLGGGGGSGTFGGTAAVAALPPSRPSPSRPRPCWGQSPCCRTGAATWTEEATAPRPPRPPSIP